MADDFRKMIGHIAHDYEAKGDPSGWFDQLYARAAGDANNIPWDDQKPAPALIDWLQREQPDGAGQPALVVGCGLGDDAEALEACGYAVTAFDISASAIDWCKQRWKDSHVDYEVADLFNPPADWQHAYTFVLENITVQALPVEWRTRTMNSIASFLRPDGMLLAMGWMVENEAERPSPPWPMTRAEMALWQQAGLEEVQFELLGAEGHTFRALYRPR